MPKELEEIKGFITGLISSPSTLDVPKESAVYSLNIDGNEKMGTLTGISNDRLLSNDGFVNPRYLVYRLKIKDHTSSFDVNQYQRQWFHLDTFNKKYWVWLAQDDSTTDWVDGNLSRQNEYDSSIKRDGQEEVRIALTGSTSTTSVATKINTALSALGPPNNSFLYNEVSTTWFNIILESISDEIHLKFTSNFYGNIPKIQVAAGSTNSLSSTYFSTPSVNGNILGSGLIPLNLSSDFNFRFGKLILKDNKHSFFGIIGNLGVYMDDVYSDNISIEEVGPIGNAGFDSINSIERNANLYIGTGGQSHLNSKWFGEIKRKQLDKDLDGKFIENQKCARPEATLSGLDFSNIVVPLLYSGMNSSNGMIAGAASLYGDGSRGTNFGGDDVEASGSPSCHRSLNGWIMQCLKNAGIAYESDWSAATDDGANNFHWQSLKRGMIFRVNIGTEGATACQVARDNFGSASTAAAGDALTELRRIKEIGFADTSAIDDAAAEGVELHDGDLFQVVTTPSGSGEGHDSRANSNGDNVNYPRLIYVGSLSGNNSDHDSTNAYHAAPAWAYMFKDDSTFLYRASLAECNDADITSSNQSYTFSTTGATGNQTSSTSFAKRITNFDLSTIIEDDGFEIGTVANCISTDGDGNINGRTVVLNNTAITGIAADSTTSTFTIGSHSLIVGDWVTISGSHADYNGTHQVTAEAATTFTISSSSTETGTSGSPVVNAYTKNHYAGHGKLWVTSSNPLHSSNLWLVDVVNWHGDDADNPRVTAKKFNLDFGRIHSSLISNVSGQGLIEEPYWSTVDPNLGTEGHGWVDRNWHPAPKDAFIGSICETHSNQAHLDDGAATGVGTGKWRIWLSYTKKNEDDRFLKWDLFLFNIRPTELYTSISNKAFMYDKTPPYQECGSIKFHEFFSSYQKMSLTTDPIYFPKDKFQILSNWPINRDAFQSQVSGKGNPTDVYFTNGDHHSNKDANLGSFSSYHYCTGLTAYHSTASEINILVAHLISDTDETTNALNYNTRRLGSHFFVKGDEATQKVLNQAYYNGEYQNDNGTIYRDKSEISYGIAGVESENKEARGGPMFRDPSGMWHLLEAAAVHDWDDNLIEDSGLEYNVGNNSSIQLGRNIGWLNSGYEDTSGGARQVKTFRHSLVPFHLEWFRTDESISYTDWASSEGDSFPVAHQINLACQVTGEFVTFGGRIVNTINKSVDPGMGYGDNGWSWGVLEGGDTESLENTSVIFQCHDTPVAFSPAPASGSDQYTDSTTTKWNSGHETQGRPGIIDSDTTMQIDIEANFGTNKAVSPTQGFSAYNQFRYGHDKNGTDGISTDDYNSNSLWNNWESYVGQDGFGHYINITNTFSSVENVAFWTRSPFNVLADDEVINETTFDRLRNFNTAYTFGDIGIYDGEDIHSSPNFPQNDTDITNGGVDGSGYFTFHANKNDANGTDSARTQLRGYYPSTDNWFLAEPTLAAIVSGNNAPLGTKWDNRRIVQCWSTLSGDTGWKLYTSGQQTSLRKNPRCAMRILDKAFSTYDGNDEIRDFLTLNSMDSISIYDTTDSRNIMSSGLLISGQTETESGDASCMVGVYKNNQSTMQPAMPLIDEDTGDEILSNYSVNNINFNYGAIRPQQKSASSVTYNSKRAYFNNDLKFKNLTPTSFLAGNDYDIYCPIILGNNSENEKTIMSIFRRSQWPTMSTSAQSKDAPYYNFDRFYNLAGSDAEVTPYGLDNSAGTNLNTRYPSEFIGSTAGTNTGDTDTATGTDLTAAGVHNKTQKIHNLSSEELNEDIAGIGEFKLGDKVDYRISYLYDGFQDSPLSTRSWPHKGLYSGSDWETGALDKDYEGLKVTLRLPSVGELNLNKRVTDILIWRRNNRYESYRFVKQINLSQTSILQTDTEGRYKIVFDDEKSFETYENLTGLSQTIEDTHLNYSIAASVSDYHFVAGAWVKNQDNIDNFVFRSKVGKFSIFDWSNDFIAMPSKPLALAGWNGKLYVFAREFLYTVNPEQMFIESINEGIGILNSKSVVVTDFGMFFCDANNMYHHDGTSPKPIGDTVLRNQSNPEWNIGYKGAVKKALFEGFNPFVQFDGQNHCVYFIIQGYNEGVSSYTSANSRAYCYSFKTGRFDYLEMPAVKSTCIGRDGETIVFDGHQIWNYRDSNHIKRTWSWDSKSFDLGSLVNSKVFKSLKLTGSPTVSDISGGENDDVLVYIDGKQQEMSLENKNYSITESIAGYSASQNWDGYNDADSGAVYSLTSALPGKDETTNGATIANSFVLNPSSMPEFVSGTLTNNKKAILEGEIERLKYISTGQYLMMEMTNSANNNTIKEIVKVTSVNFIWTSRGFISRVEIGCERGQLGTSSYDFETALNTDQNWKHSSIKHVGVSLKFPLGAKGKSMNVKLRNQTGFVESISFIYRAKSIK